LAMTALCAVIADFHPEKPLPSAENNPATSWPIVFGHLASVCSQPSSSSGPTSE
jgi:hypothetical protein